MAALNCLCVLLSPNGPIVQAERDASKIVQKGKALPATLVDLQARLTALLPQPGNVGSHCHP